MERVIQRLSYGAAALVLTGGLFTGGCRNAMYEENAALHNQNRNLQQHADALRGELQARPDPAQVAQLQSELAQRESEIAERDRLIAEMQGKLAAPQADGTKIPGIDGVEIDYNAGTREMTMRVPGDVVFASGSITVNKSAESTLNRIADILNRDYAGKRVRVEGHTDSDPISKTKKQYADNRELSLKRAYAVTKLLETRGVKGDRIETVGHGQFKSLGRGKQRDRRVEIIVVGA